LNVQRKPVQMSKKKKKQGEGKIADE